MNNKVLEIWEQINLQNEITYLKLAFSFFVNNEIDVNELKEILNFKKIELPDYFYSLDLFSQKKFLKTEIYYIDLKNDSYNYTCKTIFNNFYFYYLVNKAKRNKEYTSLLIEYVNNINQLNITFYAAKFINLKNTKLLVQYKDIKNYVEKNHIVNFYDLLMNIYVKKGNEEIKKILKKVLKNNNFLYLDLDNTFTKFALYIECLIYLLPAKIKDIVKLKFLILNKEHFPFDKISKMETKINVLKNYDNYFTNYALKQVIDFVNKNNNIPPNGYLAFYYALMERKNDE